MNGIIQRNIFDENLHTAFIVIGIPISLSKTKFDSHFS
jgi:hypothetical protein